MARRAYPTDLTDDEWQLVEPHLPAAKPGGRPRSVDVREILNATRHLLRSGCAWRLLPHEFPAWQTVYASVRRWQADGTWQRLLAHAQTKSDAVGEVDWDVVVDATIVRAHQHAAGARKGDPATT